MNIATKSFFILFASLLTIGAGCSTSPNTHSTQNTTSLNNEVPKEYIETAVFAGGCFWCIESGFEHYQDQGVIDAVSGFAGGSAEDAEYQKVASGKTDHLEAVEVYYDSRKILYDDLLEIYWRQFDPTDEGGSFVDRGKQYTSAIFYQNETQKLLAEKSKQKMQQSDRYDTDIVTPIVELDTFYEAEPYHQDYHSKNPENYFRYRNGSGRDQYIERVWGDEKYYQVPKRQYSEQELRSMLTPEQYTITQEDGTERPFDNEYWDNTEPGIYVDLITGEPLFSSVHKYKSGTGWPSFTEPISNTALKTNLDYKLVYPRTELRSRQGNNHLGHVFEDGPEEKGGLRYCINSAAIRFVPVEDMEKEGYKEYLSLFEQTGEN